MKVNIVEVIYAIVGVTLLQILGATFGLMIQWGSILALLGVALFLEWRARRRG